MTPKELAPLRGVLETKIGELEALLRNREAIAINSSADMLDQIQHATERDMAMGNLARESALLSEVRGALSRIHLGTFGTCCDCDEEISLRRLTAVPWSASCIVCQEAADRRGKLPLDMTFLRAA